MECCNWSVTASRLLQRAGNADITTLHAFSRKFSDYKAMQCLPGLVLNCRPILWVCCISTARRNTPIEAPAGEP